MSIVGRVSESSDSFGTDSSLEEDSMMHCIHQDSDVKLKESEEEKLPP